MYNVPSRYMHLEQQAYLLTRTLNLLAPVGLSCMLIKGKLGGIHKYAKKGHFLIFALLMLYNTVRTLNKVDTAWTSSTVSLLSASLYFSFIFLIPLPSGPWTLIVLL